MGIKLGKLKNYFNNDELASNVWLTKYALKDKSGKVLEETPDDMHNRIASEFARIEEKFGGDSALTREQIFDLIKNFYLIGIFYRIILKNYNIM